MAVSNDEPTIRDVMVLLKAVSCRLECLETKMSIMDSIEKRMESFEKDLRRQWLVHDERAKKVDERVSRLEDKLEGSDIHFAGLAEKIQGLVKERDTLR